MERGKTSKLVRSTPALRLVHDADRPQKQDQPKTDSKRPGLRNPLVQFMNQYADAIDREVKALLDL